MAVTIVTTLDLIIFRVGASLFICFIWFCLELCVPVYNVISCVPALLCCFYTSQKRQFDLPTIVHSAHLLKQLM